MRDAKGRELNVGDVILVPYRIESIHPDDHFNFNVSARSLRERPDRNKEWFSGNATTVFRANPGDENGFSEMTRDD